MEKYVDLYILEAGINPDWRDILFDFAAKAVTEVRPSSIDLNDSLDFNEYVTIVPIPWGEMFDSKYVAGVVL